MWARDQNESSVGLFYQTLSKNESIRVRQNKYIFVCVVCVLFFLLTLVSPHSSKNWKLKKCVRGERLTRCAHTKFSRGIERDDEGGVNVSNKNKIEIVCETINERYLWAHLRVYIYIWYFVCERSIWESVCGVLCSIKTCHKTIVKLS
jgi:hypothetical protein